MPTRIPKSAQVKMREGLSISAADFAAERERVTGLRVVDGDTGSRGAIYSYRVQHIESGVTVYEAPKNAAAEAYVLGVYEAKAGMI